MKAWISPPSLMKNCGLFCEQGVLAMGLKGIDGKITANTRINTAPAEMMEP